MRVILEATKDMTLEIDVTHSLRDEFGDPVFAAQLGMASGVAAFLESLLGLVEPDPTLEITDDDTTETIAEKVCKSLETMLYDAAAHLLSEQENNTEDWTDMFKRLGKDSHV